MLTALHGAPLRAPSYFPRKFAGAPSTIPEDLWSSVFQEERSGGLQRCADASIPKIPAACRRNGTTACRHTTTSRAPWQYLFPKPYLPQNQAIIFSLCTFNGLTLSPIVRN